MRIGLVLGIAEITVESRCTALERAIDALSGALVVVAHRPFQAVSIDAYGCSELAQGRAALQIAVAHEDADRHWRGLCIAEAVFPDRGVITDQPGRSLLRPSAIGNHGGADVVIRVRLIGE